MSVDNISFLWESPRKVSCVNYFDGSHHQSPKVKINTKLLLHIFTLLIRQHAEIFIICRAFADVCFRFFLLLVFFDTSKELISSESIKPCLLPYNMHRVLSTCLANEAWNSDHILDSSFPITSNQISKFQSNETVKVLKRYKVNMSMAVLRRGF